MKKLIIPLLAATTLLSGCHHVTVRHGVHVVAPVQVVEHRHVYNRDVVVHRHDGGQHSGHRHAQDYNYQPNRVVVVNPPPVSRHRVVTVHGTDRGDHYPVPHGRGDGRHDASMRNPPAYGRSRSRHDQPPSSDRDGTSPGHDHRPLGRALSRVTQKMTGNHPEGRTTPSAQFKTSSSRGGNPPSRKTYDKKVSILKVVRERSSDKRWGGNSHPDHRGGGHNRNDKDKSDEDAKQSKGRWKLMEH